MKLINLMFPDSHEAHVLWVWNISFMAVSNSTFMGYWNTHDTAICWGASLKRSTHTSSRQHWKAVFLVVQAHPQTPSSSVSRRELHCNTQCEQAIPGMSKTSGKRLYPLASKKKLRAPVTRSTLLGSRPDLDHSVRTALICKNLLFLHKRLAYEEICTKTHENSYSWRYIHTFKREVKT